MSGERTELKPLGSSVRAELDGEEQQATSSWFQKVHHKLANVDWKKVTLLAVILVGNFVVFCSISLIGAFFPTEVSLSKFS